MNRPTIHTVELYPGAPERHEVVLLRDYEALHRKLDNAQQAVPLSNAKQVLNEQAAPVAVPDGYQMVPKKITPEMIESALGAHYGARRVRQAGGPIGVDMTANGLNYNGIHAMRRMWAGALAAVPTPPAQNLSKLERLLAEEERSHGITIDQRDRAEEYATKLAEEVGKHFGRDVGEHSSENCLWENALELLNTAPPVQQPVALRFPTMLRKMWSGGDVQAWLDQQGPLYAAPPAQQSDLKRLCTSFYYWWSNLKGMNTEQGFDDWFEREGRAMLGDTVAPEQAEQDAIRGPELTPDLAEILGRPNFMCADLAHLLRQSGQQIGKKAEAEQAVVIHWLLGFYLQHGSAWKEKVGEEIKRLSEKARARLEGGE